MYERTSLMCTLFYIHHILYVVQKKMLLMLNIHICILNFTYTRARFMNDASATFRSRQQFPATRDASVANFIFRFSCMNASLSGTFHECQQNSIQQWQWRWGMTTWTSPIMLAVLWLSIIYCHLAWLMITGTQIGSNAYFSSRRSVSLNRRTLSQWFSLECAQSELWTCKVPSACLQNPTTKLISTVVSETKE